MKRNPEAFAEVDSAVDRLCDELAKLEDELGDAHQFEELGLDSGEPDLATVCALVEVASDHLVEAISYWMPTLVPTPRGLDEVLSTLAEWQPNAQSLRMAQSAKRLIEQLKAPSYDRTPRPDQFPALDEFATDLRAMIDRLEEDRT